MFCDTFFNLESVNATTFMWSFVRNSLLQYSDHPKNCKIGASSITVWLSEWRGSSFLQHVHLSSFSMLISLLMLFFFISFQKLFLLVISASFSNLSYYPIGKYNRWTTHFPFVSLIHLIVLSSWLTMQVPHPPTLPNYNWAHLALFDLSYCLIGKYN